MTTRDPKSSSSSDTSSPGAGRAARSLPPLELGVEEKKDALARREMRGDSEDNPPHRDTGVDRRGSAEKEQESRCSFVLTRATCP
jgi:hypothetical protein